MTLVFLWCMPRARSSALLRVLSNRDDTVGYFEPLNAILMSGPQSPMTQANVDLGLNDKDEDATVQALVAKIQKDLADGKNVIVKDFGFTGVNMAKHLPTANAKHIFLIRHPALIGKSWITCLKKIDQGYAKAIMSLDARTTDAQKKVTAYHMLHNLYETLKEGGAEPMVIDSADLAAKPEETAKAVSEYAGLEFNQAQLTWEPKPAGDFPDNWRVSKASKQRNDKLHFIDGCITSTGLLAGDDGDPAKIPLDALNEGQRNRVQISIPPYEQFTALRAKIN